MGPLVDAGPRQLVIRGDSDSDGEAPSWVIEFKGGPDPIVTPGVDGRPRLIWPETVSELAIVCTLPIPDEPGMARFRLRIETEGAAEFRKLIDGLYVRVKRRAEAPSDLLMRLTRSLVVGVDKHTLVCELAYAAAFSGVHQCHIRFIGDCREIVLPKIILEAWRTDATVGETTLDMGAPFRAPPLKRPEPEERQTVTVAGWDLGHNPVGRAYLLAEMAARRHEVELVGPIFGRFGRSVWGPLADARLPVRSFAGGDMAAFLEQAQRFAASVHCSIFYASKARLPSLLLGLLVKHRTGCRLVLDIDDHELAFYPDSAGPRALSEIETAPDDSLPDHLDPFGEAWTSATETLIQGVDGLTVANPELQRRHGGVVVRHARDERRFRPDPAVRARVREEFGVAEHERVILFLGTPRLHKGLARIAEAMDRLGDERLRLIIIGTPGSRDFMGLFKAFPRARVSQFPDEPWERLPELVQIADGVCLMQDEGSAIARAQTPAKLTDALAVGAPVAVTPLPSLTDIPSPTVLTQIGSDEDLDAWLTAVADGEGPRGEGAAARRTWFDQELSYGVNAARIGGVFEDALARPSGWNPEWTRLFRLLNARYGSELPEDPPAWVAQPPPAPGVLRRRPFTLVGFWKQNDTGIYGRRHEMLIKHLIQSGRVERVLQFDAPIALRKLHEAAAAADPLGMDHNRLVVDGVVRRHLRLDDSRTWQKRVFLHKDGRDKSFLGSALPTLDAYADFVSGCLKELPDGPRVGWVWPIAPGFPEVAEAVPFDLLVADLVDDQRAMASGPRQAQECDDRYAWMLDNADLVFTNCEPIRQAFSLRRSDIEVIPNACELPGEGAPGGPPLDLAGLPRPIIGYVGNLRDRVNVPLLRRIAMSRPQCSLVLIGSAHLQAEVLGLRSLPNVHLLGPRAYPEAEAYIRAFDVAIMPHLKNAISECMNPLKLYVYAALGVPVVTADVSNIDDVRPWVSVAADDDDFIRKLDEALARSAASGARVQPTVQELWPVSWPQRVTRILDRLDAASVSRNRSRLRSDAPADLPS